MESSEKPDFYNSKSQIVYGFIGRRIKEGAIFADKVGMSQFWP